MLCLQVPTDGSWAKLASDDLDAVLVDHAHCEMKAATNALALAARHPSRFTLVRALSEIAREEILHFQAVLTLLERRGLPLGEPRVDAYAAELRKAAGAVLRSPATGQGAASSVRWALVDRLLVGAVIEARSCERFKLIIEELSHRASQGDRRTDDVLALYEELFPVEARHYRTFVDLAIDEAGGDGAAVQSRLSALAREEARIVRALRVAPDRATVHG